MEILGVVDVEAFLESLEGFLYVSAMAGDVKFDDVTDTGDF